MSQKSKPIALLTVGLLVFVVFASFMAYLAFNKQPSTSHQQIIDKTLVKATLAGDLIVPLDARLIETTSRTVNALSITDIAKRSLWLNKEVPFSLWSFEYKGHPLAYLQIWGPYNGWIFVQFSRASMTTLDVQVMTESASFPISVENPPQDGLWWTWIEVTTS